MAQPFPILGQTAAAVEPGDGSFDDPALRQHDKAARIGSLDDLDVDLAADAGQPILEYWSLIAAVGVKLEQEWVRARTAKPSGARRHRDP